jgi:FkbM family methyltransferase
MPIENALQLLLPHLDDRLVLFDVGARGGAFEGWERLGSKAHIIGFEPDGEECARLNGLGGNVQYLPCALGETEGVLDINIAVEPACSSAYPPIRRIYERYDRLMTPSGRTFRAPCHTLDSVCETGGLSRVDALKLDAQGFELNILRGAMESLKTCALADIEVEFNPLYEGQPLFSDVDRFMRDNGFVLWRFSEMHHYTPESFGALRNEITLFAHPAGGMLAPLPHGQIFWAMARYVRAEYTAATADPVAADRAITAATVAGTYGYWDLSVSILDKAGHHGLAAELRQVLLAA